MPITSTNLPSPPTGSFYVALDQPSNSSKDCLTNAQKQAWDCNSDAVMNINVNTSDTNDWRVSFSYNNTDGQPKSTRPMYGAQPPELKGYAAAEPMMAKGEDWGKGPAYVFHQEFDKLVILHEDAFNSTNAKRWLSDEMYTNQVLNKRVEDESDFVTEGERPWYCYWNGTVLEGFIFVGKDLTTTSATSPTTYSHENFAVSSLPSESYVSAAHASDWGRKPTVSFPSSDPAFTTISSLIDGSIPTLPIAMETGVMAQRKRHQDVSSPVETPYYDSIEQYPKMIKIEERRNFQSQETPYCQQMEISEQGIANPIENCRFDLSETESDSSRKRRSLSWALSIFKRKRSEYASSCGCEWMLQ